MPLAASAVHEVWVQDSVPSHAKHVSMMEKSMPDQLAFVDDYDHPPARTPSRRNPMEAVWLAADTLSMGAVMCHNFL